MTSQNSSCQPDTGKDETDLKNLRSDVEKYVYIFAFAVVVKGLECGLPRLPALCRKLREWCRGHRTAAASWREARKFVVELRSVPAHANTSYTNYVSFLRVCICMFATLTAISALLMFVEHKHWGMTPLFAGLYGGRMTLTRPQNFKDADLDLNARRLVLLYIMTVSYGAVVLIFAQVLRSSCTQGPVLDRSTAELLDRTLWLKWLPMEDRRRRVKFQLSDEEFQRVAGDLKLALEETLADNREQERLEQGTVIGDRHSLLEEFPQGPVERIEVVPVVDEWHSVSTDLRNGRERAASYTLRSKEGLPWMRWWYGRQALRYAEWARKLRGKLLSINLDKKKLSGCAFVTFARAKERDSIMRSDPPRCSLSCSQSTVAWRRIFRGYTLFSFGRIPFASVTLKCEPAPHPDDVYWQNLHKRQAGRAFRFWLSTTALFVFVTVLVNPELLETGTRKLANRISRGRPNNGEEDNASCGGLHTALAAMLRVQALVILAVNSLLVPTFIEMIAKAERSKQHSICESRQLNLNFSFLLINVAILPVIQVDAIAGVITFLTKFIKDREKGLEDMTTQILSVNSILIIKYLYSATFISNSVGLLQTWCLWVAQGLTLAFSAVTERECREAQSPPTWAWGYWYGWGLCMVAISLGMSVMIPGTLPVATLFFIIKHWCDRYNLDHGVFALGPENNGLHAIGVAHHMELIVGGWWIVMGVVLGNIFRTKNANVQMRWEGQLGLAVSMIVMGGTVILSSWIYKVYRQWSNSMHARRSSTNEPARQMTTSLFDRLGSWLNVNTDQLLESAQKKGELSWDVRSHKELLHPDEDVDRVVQHLGTYDRPRNLAALTELRQGFDHRSSFCRRLDLEEVHGADSRQSYRGGVMSVSRSDPAAWLPHLAAAPGESSPGLEGASGALRGGGTGGTGEALSSDGSPGVTTEEGSPQGVKAESGNSRPRGSWREVGDSGTWSQAIGFAPSWSSGTSRHERSIELQALPATGSPECGDLAEPGNDPQDLDVQIAKLTPPSWKGCQMHG